jgi:glutathione peroxidase
MTSNKADEEKQLSAPIYGFKAKTIDGGDVDFRTYKGDVLLIVNTASECGFTPQYKELEELNKQFGSRGLKVLGFPCNQFGHQEPGDSKTIAAFCQKNFGVTFQMFEKIDVNGKDAAPIYKYLTSAAPGILGSENIKWNFTKFLVDRKGNVVKRFAPDVTPNKIAPEIEKLL